MRRLCVFLLLGMLTTGTAWAESVVVTRAWTRVRKMPSEKSSAIVIAYANDTLTVLSTNDGWTKVRTSTNVEGWVASADIGKGQEPVASQEAGMKESAPSASPNASPSAAAPQEPARQSRRMDAGI